MTTVIHKYEINLGMTDIELPKYSKIRQVGVQKDRIFIWVERIVGEERTENAKFHVVGTGTPIYPVLAVETHYRKFLKSVFEGEYVWHVYQVLPNE